MRRRVRRRVARADAPRVIVVGAGFAGLAAVRELARAGMQVMLVDHNGYSTFQPLLYQVATAGLNPGDVVYSARAFTRRHAVRFRLGELTGIDAAHRRITLADGGQFEYDYLVLATGVSAAYYGVKGAAENSLGLYTRRDAVALRDHIMARLERLDIGGPGKDVNFTIAGGGATGVELAGALAELRETALDAAFPDVDLANVHITLVEMAPVLLAPFDPALQEYAHQELVRRGVEVRLSTEIREVTRDCVLLANGEDLPSDVTIWAAGVAAPAVAGRWGLPQGRGGRILTGPDLRVHGQDRAFAAGDIALVRRAAAAPARAACHPVRAARRTAGGAAGERARDGPARLSRQGDHGDGRAAQRGRPAAARRAGTRDAGLAGLARPAPGHAARRAQPAVRADQPVLALRELGPRRGRHRRR